MQAGERQLGFRLNTTAANRSHPRLTRSLSHIRTPRGIVQQRRLADTHIPADDEHTASSSARTRQQVINNGLLSGPPIQHRNHLPDRAGHVKGDTAHHGTNGEAIDLLTDAHQEWAGVAGRSKDRYRRRGNGQAPPLRVIERQRPDKRIHVFHIFFSVAADDAGGWS